MAVLRNDLDDGLAGSCVAKLDAGTLPDAGIAVIFGGNCVEQILGRFAQLVFADIIRICDLNRYNKVYTEDMTLLLTETFWNICALLCRGKVVVPIFGGFDAK